jgi:hypothetical protein
MSYLNVLTNLFIIPRFVSIAYMLFFCYTSMIVVSNLISLPPQNFLIGALENSLLPSNPLINPTSSLNP